MAEQIETNPFLTGIWAPMREELDLCALHVTGTIPEGLEGEYLRIGPNPLQPDPWFYHPFIGDGMVHGVAISGGKATWYRNRFIRSRKVSKLLGIEPAPGPRRSGDTVNTSISLIAGKVFGLVEGGSTPVELSGHLAGQTYSDFGGTLAGSFSAHPHRDALTGEMHAVTYQWMQPGQAAYVVVDAAGRVTKEQPLGLAHGPMIHDCAFTQRYALILDMPAAFVPQAAQAGSPFPYAWQPDMPCRIGLLPRTGSTQDIIWCTAPLSFVYHVANAFDCDDGTIILDVCAFDTMFAETGDRSRGLERWTIDPAARSISIRSVDGRPQDFPRIDERRCGQKHRYVYTLSQPEDPNRAGSSLGNL